MNEKILIIHDGPEAEIIASLPLAYTLSEQNNEIHFLAKHAPQLLAHQSYITKELQLKNNVLSLIKEIRKEKYNSIYNLSKNFIPSIITIFASTPVKVGFNTAPFSFLYTQTTSFNNSEYIGTQYLSLINDSGAINNYNLAVPDKNIPDKPFMVFAPFYDQPMRKHSLEFWKKLINKLPLKYGIYIIGSEADRKNAEELAAGRINVKNICGKDLEYHYKLIEHSYRTFCNYNLFIQFAPALRNKIVLASDIAFEKKYIPQNDLLKNIDISGDVTNAMTLKAFDAMEYRAAIEDLYSPNEKISVALDILQNGGLIVQETDTISGISGLAINKNAVSRIHNVKGRDPSKAMLILCSSIRMVKNYVTHIPEKVFEIMDKAGDLPLTIIYPTGKNLPENLLAQDNSIGIRIPASTVLQNMINTIGFPIISTSANHSGEKAPVHLAEISAELLQKIDFILDVPAKENNQSTPSTILKVNGENVEIIRKGEMSAELQELIARQ